MHNMAFGAALPEENIPALIEHANKTLKNVDFGSSTVDVDLHLNYAHKNIVKQFGEAGKLYGNSIPQPKFMFDLLISKSDFQAIGKAKNTLKIAVNGLEFIKFWASDDIEKLSNGKGVMKVRIVGRPDINEFMGRVTPQVKVDYIEILEEEVSLF